MTGLKCDDPKIEGNALKKLKNAERPLKAEQ